MPKETKGRVISKKHLARIERERLQTRYILIGSLIVILAVVVLVSYGLLEKSVISPLQPVAKVNGVKISTRQFQALVRYSRQGIVNRYVQYAQFMQAFGSDPDTQNMLNQQLQQISSQLDPIPLGQRVLDDMIANQLIAAEAKVRGITVSEEEINKFMQENFGYYPNGTPTAKPELPTDVPATLSPTQLVLVTATPTITPTLPVTYTPAVTVTPSVTVTPQATATTTPTPQPTPTALPTSSPTPFTEEMYEKQYQEVVDNFNQSINLSEQQFREILRSYLLRDKVMEAITADIGTQQEQIWIKDLLVADEATARAAFDRLAQGEEFANLVNELSTDAYTKSKGGDNGWQAIDAVEEPIAAVAKLLEIGNISSPVQDSRGWHIIQLVGRRTHNLSTTELDNLRQTKFDEWLAQKREAAEITIYDYWMDRVPEEPTIPNNIPQ